MDIQFVSDLVKVVSAITGGALGIGSVLFSYKDDAGKINSRGRLVIAAIAASALMGSAATIIDSAKSQADSKEKVARDTKIINNLDRSMNPLQSATAFYMLRSAPKNPIFASYTHSLINNLSGVLNDLGPLSQKDDPAKILVALTKLAAIHLSSPMLDPQGRVFGVRVDKDSPMRPTDDEKCIADAFDRISLTIFFYLKPIIPEQFVNIISVRETGPDLIMMPFPEIKVRGIDVNLQDESIGVTERRDILVALWWSNGKITSLLDFSGAQIIIPLKTEDIKGCSSKIGRVAGALKFSAFSLNFGNGRAIHLPSGDMKRTVLSDSCVIFSYIFPKDSEEIRKLWTAAR